MSATSSQTFAKLMVVMGVAWTAASCGSATLNTNGQAGTNGQGGGGGVAHAGAGGKGGAMGTGTGGALAATGGASGSAGGDGKGGSAGSGAGGTTASGGTTGTTGTGGTSATGTGGTAGSGGKGGSGGAVATGGTVGTGGAAATGGKGGSGGAVATGGTGGTGGTVPTGGMTGTGGTVANVTLTVSFAGAGAGTVAISPGSTTCSAPTTCMASFAPGTAVTLTAKPTNGGSAVSSVLSGWTGACAANGPYRFCTLTLNASATTSARFDKLSSNFVFTSSSAYSGALGSAAAYRNACNTLATAAGLNTATNDAYVAWVAATNYAPLTLLGSSRGWVRADLRPWIDNLTQSLSVGNVYYPAAYDENGQRIIASTLAGMNASGVVNPGYNCADWTDSTLDAAHGSTHAGGPNWWFNNEGVSSCATPSHLICMSKGSTAAVSVTPATGKKIYVTKSPWTPSGGLAAADGRCLADAPAGVTAAKAVLVASTRALSAVLGPTTTYVRPDGVIVGVGADIAQAMNNGVGPPTLEAPVSQDGAGSYFGNSSSAVAGVWTGLNFQGTAAQDTCRDWTSSSASDTGTAGCVDVGWQFAGKCANWACDANASTGTANVYLQCAEQ